MANQGSEDSTASLMEATGWAPETEWRLGPDRDRASMKEVGMTGVQQGQV